MEELRRVCSECHKGDLDGEPLITFGTTFIHGKSCLSRKLAHINTDSMREPEQGSLAAMTARTFFFAPIRAKDTPEAASLRGGACKEKKEKKT